ncbi:MDR family MFS transporter [Staphylococcus hyicus]|uniref:MDR family MFS transporter n=2 Tax=Staphylococcus hyicus TaxID=1284 RepID=A0ACD5FNV1_STAHY|nr:MDR family MFS transporter [Staphylococcus hyicus]AJC95496.1 MFS transporter [Staphylococcus hyicus]MCE5154047.1 multidrug efflux MFS transporter [Staphylococcus hyicus]MDP4449065.1 MDR family MFS transporter [Staphylococcus hyicus]MDP4460806.1 MDR family MFS transporter [Staphylococcus hyicus]MDP4463103.1 MDR family MFS transporter [Staphylococcus hyicus]
MATKQIGKDERNIIVAVMLISAFTAILNQTLLNTALPDIMKGLNIDESTSQWLVTGFMLVNGIMIPLTAYFMDRIPTRTLYMIAMGIFLLGSFIAALAPNFAILMIARVIQAMGAGIIMPLSQFTMFTLFPKDQRGFAMGLSGLVIQFAPAIGPTLSGVLVDHFSWRVPLIVVVVVAVIGYIFGFKFMHNFSTTKSVKLDKVSVILSTLGFGMMLYAFSIAGTMGFHHPIVIISLSLSLIIIFWFIKRQLSIDHPILRLEAFKNRTFALTSIASMIAFTSMVGPALLVPIYIQNVLGLSAFLSGLVVLPGAMINGVMSVVNGKIYDKVGARILIIPGFTLLLITTLMLSQITAHTSYMYVITVFTIRLVSLSFIMMPLNTAGINALENDMVSHGTAIMNALRTISGSMGTAIMVTAMAIGASWYKPDITIAKMMIQKEAMAFGVDSAFYVASFMVFIGLVISLFIHDRTKVKKNTM